MKGSLSNLYNEFEVKHLTNACHIVLSATNNAFSMMTGWINWWLYNVQMLDNHGANQRMIVSTAKNAIIRHQRTKEKG